MGEPVWDEFAERAALGLAIQFPEAVGREFCRLGDVWYSPAHKELAGVLSGMLRSGQSVDTATVFGQLQAQGLTRNWDVVKVFNLTQNAYRPESLHQFASRLRRLSGIRTLSVACQRATQRLESVSEFEDESDIRAATQELRQACETAEAAESDVDMPAPTAMGDFLGQEFKRQWLVPGLLERMDRTVITGAEGGGKALAIDTPIPTPKGWVAMGDITPGMEVFSNDGSPVRVIAATEVMHDRPCYRVTFSDGAEIVADAGHLWLTETLLAREAASKASRRSDVVKPRGTDQRHKRLHFPEVVTTEHIAGTVMARNGHAINHSVEVTQPLQYPWQELPIDPYAMGVWLGDGTSSAAAITCHPDDVEIIDNIRAAGEVVRQREPMLWAITDGNRSGDRSATFQGRLRKLGVLNNKHIPDSYMLGSVEQRLALLQGLMDSDGTVSPGMSGEGRGSGHAKCEFSVVSEVLARGVLDLLLGLGIKVTMREGVAKLYGRAVGPRFRLVFQTDLPVFRLARKWDRLGELRTRRAKLRYITKVEPVESVPVRCIQVEREDGMFVAGRECIPTHNSVLCSQMAATLAGGVHPFGGTVMGNGNNGVRVLVIDCENSPAQSQRRYRWVIDRVDEVRATSGFDPVNWNEQMQIDMKPKGVDLLGGRDMAWIEHAIQACAPDLLVLGPLYKLHRGEPSDEVMARDLAWALDGLRERYGFALLTEAHAGHSKDQSTGKRIMRPIGSSLWLRWPEFGFGLSRATDDPGLGRAQRVDVVSWRGSREERAWPDKLAHGATLPWLPDADYFQTMNDYE